MNNIIEKLGIEEIESNYRINLLVNSDDLKYCYESEVRELEQQRDELLEMLDDIIRKQYEQSYCLADLNNSIRFARISIIKMFPEIRELNDE